MEQGWNLTFASSASESDYSENLEQLGIHCQSIRLNDSSFDDFIKNLQPDVVLFDRFMTEEQYGWRVAEQCPDALRILDTEDLHSLRSARRNALKTKRLFKPEDLLTEEVAKREIASLYRCDLSLMISKAEMEILQDVFKVDKSLLHYLPFLLDRVDEKETRDRPVFEERNHFISIGNFLHPPNWDAVLYLKEEIWPLIRKKLPGAELHVYGAYPSQKVQNLHQPKDGFLIKGRAKDSRQVIGSARILLAPLRFGAGLKGKLVEAMQCGTPSVTTDIGAEGIAGAGGWSGAVANQPDKIAAEAVKLYQNKTIWKKAQQAGIEILNREFLKSDWGPPFIQRMLSLQKHISEHRRKNFTGSMLMHHTANSTKFMSKWIEEKNK